jgi:hypothetical protein
MVDPPTVPVQWLWKRRPDHVGDLAILTNFVRPEPHTRSLEPLRFFDRLGPHRERISLRGADVFTATEYV